jgi:hypothetical protein
MTIDRVPACCLGAARQRARTLSRIGVFIGAPPGFGSPEVRFGRDTCSPGVILFGSQAKDGTYVPHYVSQTRLRLQSPSSSSVVDRSSLSQAVRTYMTITIVHLCPMLVNYSPGDCVPAEASKRTVAMVPDMTSCTVPSLTASGSRSRSRASHRNAVPIRRPGTVSLSEGPGVV